MNDQNLPHNQTESQSENQIQIRVEQELQKLLSDPRKVISFYAKALQDADDKIHEMQTHITEVLLPKAEVFDLAMGSETLNEMSTVAKTLNFKKMGRNKLFAYLKDKGVLRYNKDPYQQYVDAKYFKIIEQVVNIDDYHIISNKTMVTQRGLNFIGKLLLEDGYELNPR